MEVYINSRPLPKGTVLRGRSPGGALRRSFPWLVGVSAVLGLLAGGVVARGPVAAAGAEIRRPSILFVLVDDLGWSDLHCQGNALLSTPHVDRFATEGMRFTDAYAAAPVCSPSRAAILTGQSPARLRITNHIPDQERFTPEDAVLLPAPMRDRLPLESVTIAERLREAGHRTGFFGKWHLCGPWSGELGRGDEAFHPEHQGFEVNIGGCALGGPPTFFDPYQIDKLPSRRPGEYLPDRLADETIAFIEGTGGAPFLAFLWNYTVHWPMEAPEALVERYRELEGKPGIKDARYAAMIEAMDAAFGRVLAALDRLGRRDDTLVVFTSDNGGFGGVADNRPLRGDKGHLYEGGIRVPLIIRWPGVVRAGSVCDTPVIGTDFHPTILEALGLPPAPDQPLDGESLLPLLRETGALRREAIHFHYPNYAFHRSNRLGGAIRRGDWKLIERFDDGELELFNLNDDPGESRNRALEEPATARELAEELRAWRTAVDAAMPIPRPQAP